MSTPPTPTWFTWFLNTGGALIKTSAILVFLGGFYNVFMKDDVLEWYTDFQVGIITPIIHKSDSIQSEKIILGYVSYTDSIHSMDTIPAVVSLNSLSKEEVKQAVSEEFTEQFDKRFGPVKSLDTVPIFEGFTDKILYYIVPHYDGIEILPLSKVPHLPTYKTR